MSHKIYRDGAAKQKAYRDQERARKRSSELCHDHARWNPVGGTVHYTDVRGKAIQIKGCPLCFPTP
jgi:hypothetical protein